MEEDVESERAPPAAAVSQPAGITTRRLKSFPPPDLAVVVGPQKRLYRYHSFMLASLSAYVDTMLSSPMKEQESMHITFPDISTETWEKMIGFLEPGAYPRLSWVDDIAQVLPFYDKYDFIDGLALCDAIIRGILTSQRDRPICCAPDEELVVLVVMSHELNLPLSKGSSIEFACRQLKRLYSGIKAEQIKALLPLVESEDSILVSLVRIIRGRHSRDMSIEEMRNLTMEETFADQCVARSEEIEGQEKILESLVVDVIMVVCRGPLGEKLAEGKYKLKRDNGNPGAMKNSYRKERRYNEAAGTIVLESMDPFGIVWEIAEMGGSGTDDEGEEENGDECSSRRVLYRWDSGFSSLVPPMAGWVAVEQDLPVLSVTYTIKEREY